MIKNKFIKAYNKVMKNNHLKIKEKKSLRDYLMFGMHIKICSFSAIDKLEEFVSSLYNSGDIDVFDYYLYIGILDEYRNILPELLQNAT